MSAIKNALSKLDGAVGKLESSLTGFEQSVEQRQRDMFDASPSNQNIVADNGQSINGAALASRLDSAIDKVEEILKESA